MSQKKYIGLISGLVSVKAVLINERKEILENHYVRSHGQRENISSGPERYF